MKLQVERDQLAEAVAWTARALPTRPTAPVLAGMRLHAGAELTLSTFDYEVSAQATVPVITDEEGTVLVSGRLLAEIVRSLPARPVELVTDGTRATLKCGSATFTLVLLPEEEYPTLPEMPPLAGSVGSDALATAIGQVATAAGRDDTLPALTGIRIEITGDTLTLVATDRYRLAVRELRWNPARPDLSTAVLVPARVLGDTARALTAGAEVAISLGGESLIGFAGAGRQTTARLLSGEYPKYASLLPSEFSATAELAADSFAEAVKRVALVAERNTPVRLAFSAGQLVLEAGASEEAQATEIVEGRLRRRGSADCLQPAVPAGRHRGDRLRHRPDLIHLADQAGRHHRQDRARARLPLRAHADPQRGIGQSQAVLSICALDSAGADGLSVLCGRQY